MSEQVPKIIAEINEKMNLLGDIAIKAEEAKVAYQTQITTLQAQVKAIPNPDKIKLQAIAEYKAKLKEFVGV